MSDPSRLLIPRDRTHTGSRRWKRWGLRVVAGLLAAGAVAVMVYSAYPWFSRMMQVPALPDESVVADSTRRRRDAEQRIAAIQARAACEAATPARVRALVDSVPTWRDDVLAGVACRKIWRGMYAAELRASWGPPVRILPIRNPMRPAETWVYGGKKSVILWDGRVRSWQ